MPPQQVFCVQEILAEILNKIRDDPRDDGATAHRSLARLARTCKTISDLALDALWYRQFSLEPFLHLLGDAIAEQKVSKDRFEVWITVCAFPGSSWNPINSQRFTRRSVLDLLHGLNGKPSSSTPRG